MNLFDRFVSLLARGYVRAEGAVKGTTINLTPPWARYAFSAPTFRSLATEGYKGNGAVFACISALAFAFPEPRLFVWEETEAGKTPLPRHGLSLLLRRPNPQMSLAKFLMYTIVYMAVGGNCYWYKVRSRAGRVVELWPIHDGQITPVAGGSKLISHYEFDNGTGTPDRIEASEIVHLMWMPDPLAPWKGLAPLVSVAREVDTDNEATRYLFSLLKNDAMPRIAIVAKDDLALADSDVRKRVKEEWQQEQGGANRGRVALLEGGLDVKTIALNLKELEFNVLRRVPEARMCAAFRVPPIVAGVNVGLENATYSNFKEAILLFTERTLVPLWGAVDDEVSNNLLPEFGGTATQVAEFDLDRVIALAEKKMAARTWAGDALGRGAITVNEFRAVAGLPPDANGDVYLRTLAQVAEPFQMRIIADSGTTGQKGLAASATKEARRRAAVASITAQRVARRDVAGRMEAAVDGYFGQLADHVLHRARKSWAPDGIQTKKLPKAEDLITAEDVDELEALIKRFYVELLQLSWGTWNLALGVDIDFRMEDPLVVEILAGAGERVKLINATTLDQLRYVLQVGAQQGWSIDHLIRGDPELGVPGLRDVVEQTYKNRARTIARTELGDAQNQAAATRYGDAGIKNVFVMDNGADDDDSECKQVNGTVKPLQWARDNPLEHPNCTRCFAPEFD